MSISEMTGNNTVEVELKGKTYILSSLTINDYGIIEDVMRREKIKELRTITDEYNLSGEEAAAFTARELKNVSPFDAFTSIRGLCHLVFRSISKNDKKITFDEVAELIDIGNMNEVANALAKLSARGETKNVEGQAKTDQN